MMMMNIDDELMMVHDDELPNRILCKIKESPHLPPPVVVLSGRDGAVESAPVPRVQQVSPVEERDLLERLP